MTLLRQFMAWVTASNPTPRQQMFSALRQRLLLSYLLAMTAILAVSGTAVYIFFSRSLEQQLNQRLLTLAQAAVPSLEAVTTGGLQSLEQKLPWRQLFYNRHQSLEWFDAEGKLLAREGTTFSGLPLEPNTQIIRQANQVRTITIPISANNPGQQTLRVEGYIRASESTHRLEEICRQLGWGLSLGGIVALSLGSLGGMWLIQQALEPVERSFQRLKQFTADASHELRSPLTAISAATEVIQSHPERIHPLDVKKIAAIASATNQLTQLSEDLLFLARTDATVVPPKHEQQCSIPVEEVLQDLVDLLEPQAQAQGIALKTQLLAGVSVQGEAAQLKRLFANLLDNALKYTRTGGSVVISMVKSQRFVVIRVEDTGIGIAPENLPLIFQRFWRSDRARSRQIEGAGLGLAIAQAIVQRHLGKIQVTSKVGVGSSFQVYLPLA